MAVETARKFLIRLPNSKKAYVQMLQNYYGNTELQYCSITQTYLISEEGERHIQKRVHPMKSIEYFYAEKRKISDMSHIEKITHEEYAEYLKEADPTLHCIQKMRYMFQHLGRTFELDMYPCSDDKAILEVELPIEDTYLELPSFVEVIKEVTQDTAYKTLNLAANPFFL